MEPYPFDWSKVPEGEPEIAFISEDGREHYGLAAQHAEAAQRQQNAREVREFLERPGRKNDPRLSDSNASMRAYGVEQAREAQRLRRAACEDRARLAPVRASVIAPRTAPRPRGAGRPRAAATRSTSRSGDSGDDGSGSSSDDGPAAPRRPLNGGTA